MVGTQRKLRQVVAEKSSGGVQKGMCGLRQLLIVQGAMVAQCVQIEYLFAGLMILQPLDPILPRRQMAGIHRLRFSALQNEKDGVASMAIRGMQH
jgi:hypothetical protein